MFFRKGKKNQNPPADDGGDSRQPESGSTDNDTSADAAQPPPEKPKRRGLFARLGRTRETFASGVLGLLGRGRKVDASLFDALEDELLVADVGVDATDYLVNELREAARRERIEDAAGLVDVLRARMIDVLNATENRASEPAPGKTRVTLMVGVNGVGKTTTVAKLASRYKDAGDSVMLAAADTFRAAAIEQLQTWGERLDIPVIAQSHGSDAAAVAHDALSAAEAREADQLIIDTAGRQHTHADLMEQLGKIDRVLKRRDPDTPHETLITVDAGNGQNVLQQIEQFSTQAPITGVVMTKLDGTARGGVVFAVARKFGLPIRFIGVGEAVDDLRPFSVTDFVEVLLPDAESLGQD